MLKFSEKDLNCCEHKSQGLTSNLCTKVTRNKMNTWERWTSLLLLILYRASYESVRCCTGHSLKPHRCLNTFLERDFHLIQPFFTEYSSTGRRLIVSEGPGLDDICRKIEDLTECYRPLVRDCKLYEHYVNLERIIRSLKELQILLCRNNRALLQSLLTHGACIERVRTRSKCHEQIPNWTILIRKIFRLEEGFEHCPSLYRHSKCVTDRLMSSECEPEATRVYNWTQVTWLKAVCDKGTAKESMSTIVMLGIVLFIVRMS
ncbi:uncharacterized protein LOC143229973 [Tachypleus tridentatus]|uniref:uncharacterized protein LOC143229973 n=1 Tax=Tachypleus tridentatus TaxID=6853 RepID=UPI003FCEEA6B